jgi:spore coat protein U-like protein
MARLALCLAATLLTVPAAAQSGQGSTTIAVSVEVVPNCTVSAAPLTLVPRQGAVAAASSDIAIACGPDEPFTVTLDLGAHPSGTLRRAYDPVANRYLAYDIFRDPARNQRWADGPGEVVSGLTSASGRVSLKAYGGLVSGQDLIAGNYADQVVVAVNF